MWNRTESVYTQITVEVDVECIRVRKKPGVDLPFSECDSRPVDQLVFPEGRW